MAAPTKETKLLDALGDIFDALRQAVRREGRRGIRFSKRLVSEIEQGNKEVTRLPGAPRAIPQISPACMTQASAQPDAGSITRRISSRS
jgi:hypothetical protein